MFFLTRIIVDVSAIIHMLICLMTSSIDNFNDMETLALELEPEYDHVIVWWLFVIMS